ncbi:NAD/NADP dependent alcohol dehydrogenase [Penicillium malachiteum]|uniref:NAD/NADP dependent alcohol dehydrogenase n=1 Tax=Penicillium malachiteum TaxID=1324776 RepID=UPI0025488FDF|nr:NAD/NADP dependent alcohol dehydrogenase [Penicillium malachiteum]KAJ5720347.1 NAD/NADP dependent alcohol dehydrogenase [Penicillium malachiteum]
MNQIKAIVAHEPITPLKQNWSLQDVDLKDPGDDEVLVEMYAVGICHTDIVLGSVPTGTIGVQYPKVLGHEGAGIARQVGKNVQSIEPGDPVLLSFNSCASCSQCLESHPGYCDTFANRNYTGEQHSTNLSSTDEKVWTGFFGQSSFAQYGIVHKTSIVNGKDLIQDLSELKLFASLGCGFQTGMGAIQNITEASPDDTVLITGLGAVGMGAIMTAVNSQCKTIIAIDRVKSRLNLAKELGATHIIDTSEPTFTSLMEAVHELIPTGVTIAIDTTGVPEILEQSIKATRKRGKIVMIGVPPFGWELKVPATEHLNSGRSLMGCIMGDCDSQKVSMLQVVFLIG